MKTLRSPGMIERSPRGSWTVDLRYSESDEKFRAELRSWLAREVPAHGATPVEADWAARRAYDTDWQKKLHRAGYAVSHLSHPRHGFSSTRFGMRCLNPVHTRAEDRYLRERVRLSPDAAGAALATLGDRLGGNGVVSISVRGDSRRPAMVLFLGGEIRIAVGAPVLAHKSAAALLPVFPLRTGEDGFTVFVEPALEIDPALDRRVAVADALGRYARLLERYVLDYPGQWLGWFHLRTITPRVRTSF